MRMKLFAAALAPLGLAALASPAEAKCTRLAFSVNDYGKDGPIRDAKALLDKYIAQHMAERGVKKYTVGKKDVTCELFLDFGFFDEHTCKAAATVCWGEAGGATAAAAPAGDAPAVAKTPVPAAKKAPAVAPASAPAAPKPPAAPKAGAPAAKSG
jgi:hypothetical protein